MTLGLGLIEDVPASEVRPRRARRTTVRVLVAAILVGLAANLIAAAVQPHLREPQAWPSAELQHKFDRITALAKTSPTGAGTGGTVLVGDSLLDAAADPVLITAAPRPVFNASLAGETLPVIAPWTTRVVAPRLHPSLVVLGFTVNVLNGQMPGEATLVESYNRSRAVGAAEGTGDLADRLDLWLRSHVALYRDRSVLRDPFRSAVSGGAQVYDPPLSPQGWNEGFRHALLGEDPAAQAAAGREVRLDLLRHFKVSDKRMVALGILIDELRREGARVIVVAMPVSSAVLPAVGGTPAYQSALSDLLSVAEQHGVVAVDAGLWADQYFADAVHLNAAGTSRFSEWLNSRLMALEPRP